MTDEQKRPPTSEEMIRRARERMASSGTDHPPPFEPESEQSRPDSPPPTSDLDQKDSSRDDFAATPSEHPDRNGTATDRDQSLHAPTAPHVPPKPSQPNRLTWLRRIPVGWLIVAALFAGGSIYRSIGAADRDDTGAVVGAGDVASDSFEIGDCLLFPDEADPTASFEFDHLTAVPCSDLHDMEVYAQVSTPGGPYPGATALSDLGESLCQEPFEGYVGYPVEHEARLTFSVTYPGEESWADGDRSMDCLLETWDGSQVTGSQQGQGLLSFGGLVVDSCYDYNETETYVYFTEMDCAEPHLLQIYEAGRLPHDESATYPGEEVIETAADELCVDPFLALMPAGSSEGVDFFWVAPDPDSWPFGDRLLQCFLFDPDGDPLIGNFTAEG